MSKQAQIGMKSQFFHSSTGAITDRAGLKMAGREASSVFRQARAQENSASNLQTLQQQVGMYNQMYGLNIDANQLASMYDANGNGLLSGKELGKAQNGLSMMVSYQMQNGGMSGMQGMQSGQNAAAGGGGGTDFGSAISTLTSGIGSLVGAFGGGSEAGAAEGGGESGGNWLSKAGDFVGKLFG